MKPLWTDTAFENRTVYNQTRDIIMTPPFCYVNGTQPRDYWDPWLLDPVDGQSECVFNFTHIAHHGLQNYLGSEAYGLRGSVSKSDGPCSNSDCFNFTSLFVAYLNNIISGSTQASVLQDIDTTFANLAGSVTAAIRELPRWNRSDSNRQPYFSPAQGIELESNIFKVRWSVLIFPIILIASSALFTFAVAIESTGHSWKLSNLPLLTHSLGFEELSSAGKFNGYAEMKNSASTMDVQFTKKGEWYHLVGDEESIPLEDQSTASFGTGGSDTDEGFP
jgi:heme/copper-type cytochrome/quinol oxidase subunit 3